jgi:hypothetical protein
MKRFALVCALACACRSVPPASGYDVGTVLPGFDAEGKLQRGDCIVAIDGRAIGAPVVPSLAQAVNLHRGAPVVLAVVRGNTAFAVVVQPSLDRPADARPMWVLGIRPVTD